MRELFGATASLDCSRGWSGIWAREVCSRVVSRCRNLQAASDPTEGSRFGGELLEGLAKSHFGGAERKGAVRTGRVRAVRRLELGRGSRIVHFGGRDGLKVEGTVARFGPWRFTPSWEETSSAELLAKVLSSGLER